MAESDEELIVSANEIDSALETAMAADRVIENWQAPALVMGEVKSKEPLVLSNYDDYDHWQVPGLSIHPEQVHQPLVHEVDEDEKVSWPCVEENNKEHNISLSDNDFNKEQESVVLGDVDDISIEDITVTAADLEELHKKAHEDGFAIGKAAGFSAGQAAGEAQGYQEAYAQAQAEINQKKQELEQEQLKLIEMMNSLTHPFEEVSDKLKDELLHFITQLSEEIAKEQCLISADGLKDIINQILAKLFSEEKIRISLNPVDIERIKEQENEELLSENIDFIEDDAITVGGCVVDAGASRVDMTMENRIRDITQQIFSENKNKLFNINIKNNDKNNQEIKEKNQDKNNCEDLMNNNAAVSPADSNDQDQHSES
ncbi:Flagellar assembly protein FliH [Piscirickettsia salmonis]|uniref:FliH/SctL family protein n=1 Tax=Piscirickettsia salmonis TaxID=1238 RepID=UPI0012BAECF1|nr:FliH/SctL family protein [Piscirickettsia salmonis]QGP56186.1 Flagellar assembly protein FliH [Piscirickettsia salmonis]QGP57937.1 Flagellar assembly protein FliH [Piscirickettsia salmonis]QGP65755.1 Flagellar assembly protein FliH [Piscirickettsia salmonis]